MTAQLDVTIPNLLGLHVRPAAAVAEAAAKFRSKVQIIKEGETVNAKSSIELLTLAAVKGTVLTVRAEGADAEEAVKTLAGMILSGFGET